MERDFRIKLTAFESSKTQYFCDQILSKTHKYNWSYDVSFPQKYKKITVFFKIINTF